jgi:hypothetical protein
MSPWWISSARAGPTPARDCSEMAPPARAGAALGAPRSTRLHARGPGRGGRRGAQAPPVAARAGRDGDRSPPRSPGTGFHILWRPRRAPPLPFRASTSRRGLRAAQGPSVAVLPAGALGASRQSRRAAACVLRHLDAAWPKRSRYPACATATRGATASRPQEVLLPWCGTRSTSLTRRRPWHGHLQGLPYEGPGEGRIRVLAERPARSRDGALCSRSGRPIPGAARRGAPHPFYV